LVALADEELSPAEQDWVAAEVDRTVCDALRRIRRYNDGLLPALEGIDLYEAWRMHRCD
jgi:hypothetical protein